MKSPWASDADETPEFELADALDDIAEVHERFRLRFSAFNGMGFTIDESDDRQELRARAVQRIVQYRGKGFEVNILEIGKEWEFISPSNEAGLFIGDDDGILHIDEL